MKILSLFPLFSASLCFATAIPAQPALCGPDEAVIFLTNGSTTTVKKADLASHLQGLTFLSSEASDNALPQLIKANASSPNMAKRGSSAELIIPLPDQDFLGWDVAMSTIVHANQAAATVAIQSGQSIANSITTGASADFTLVKDFLSMSTSISYQETATSTVTGTVTMTIPANKWGAIVSNPLTHRKRGYVFTGGPGGGQFEYYQADSFTDASFKLEGGTLSWVKGVVTTCLGDTYPLARCVGDGSLE
ncbi:uncharacterized protein BO97DRAFT_131764 [Aspergillus homomorphus CBS 101889]|uniref:Uncharacterized protein n=1 Tax=Aspergillus homomorphus (strain CBS 101889) TaxID=1450537 RepID=A0A395IB56_ASPHC|nr:hypothetical protein BO97DRAFT_131764 [Aspergillus homomorphus CBS 101889]RAL16363.1 hypothetical protein BO97DRAFT_131764 [Aspergillus homomorphus CBS 101889]